MTGPAPSPTATWNRGGIRLLRARRRWIVVVTVLVALSAALFSWLQPPVYRSAADVLLLSELTSPGATPPAPNMGTEKLLATSEVVVSAAAQRIGRPVEDVLRSVTVSVPAETQILRIDCSARSATGAQQCAQAIADAYVAFKDAQPIRALPERGRVVSPAPLPPAPSWPDPLLAIGAGVVLGLALGCLTAIVRDRLDDRVRGAADLDRRLRVLAVVPQDPSPEERFTAGSLRALGGLVDTYGVLNAKVLAATRPGPGPRPATPVLAVVPVAADTPGHAAALGLAAARSHAGERVVLIDADTRRDGPAGQPSDAAPGLLQVLEGDVPLPAVLQDTPVRGLTLLPLGGPSAAAVAPIVPARWARTLAELGASFDAIVVSAPALTSADGVGVARGATVVLLVVEDGRTTRSAVDDVLRECEQLRVALAGAVLTRPTGRHDRRGAATVDAGEPAGMFTVPADLARADRSGPDTAGPAAPAARDRTATGAGHRAAER